MPDPHVQQLAARLYQNMPGAPMPAMEDGYYLWGEVANEHWDFCEIIAEEIGKLRAAIREGRE